MTRPVPCLALALSQEISSLHLLHPPSLSAAASEPSLDTPQPLLLLLLPCLSHQTVVLLHPFTSPLTCQLLRPVTHRATKAVRIRPLHRKTTHSAWRPTPPSSRPDSEFAPDPIEDEADPPLLASASASLGFKPKNQARSKRLLCIAPRSFPGCPHPSSWLPTATSRSVTSRTTSSLKSPPRLLTEVSASLLRCQPQLLY